MWLAPLFTICFGMNSGHRCGAAVVSITQITFPLLPPSPCRDDGCMHLWVDWYAGGAMVRWVEEKKCGKLGTIDERKEEMCMSM